jgi:hypothetical protein
MHDATFDRVARHAGPVYDRRASLKTIAMGALLAGGAPSLTAAAGKTRQQRGKREKATSVRDGCRKQSRRCQEFLRAQCESDSPCQAEKRFLDCCGVTTACNADTLMRCMLSKFL